MAIADLCVAKIASNSCYFQVRLIGPVIAPVDNNACIVRLFKNIYGFDAKIQVSTKTSVSLLLAKLNPALKTELKKKLLK